MKQKQISQRAQLIYIRARFRFAPIDKNLTAQSTGSHVELEAEFKFQGRSCKLCFLFPPRRQIARRLALGGLAVSRLSSSYFEYYLPIALAKISMSCISDCRALDSGFQKKISEIPDSISKNFPDSGIQIPLHGSMFN